VTVSIGIACRQGDDDTPEELLARADEALYEAKRSGRNRVEVQPDMIVASGKAASG
jgi:two-component system cell cycle response regulator